MISFGLLATFFFLKNMYSLFWFEASNSINVLQENLV